MLSQTLKNRYKVTAQLGKGAMGLVYRAYDRQARQDVAIKVIAADMALEADMLARFRREGEALRQLRHRNIVAFGEMFEHQGQQVIVMEYVGGGNLHALIRRGPLPAADVVRLTLELCDALAQAHHIEIIHRDIKPENVLLTPDGVPKLTDFGIARLVGGTTGLTHTGAVMGTPYYMSPEAWSGQPLDTQADVWSLGVMVYQMVSGRLPFAGDTLPVVMNKVLTEAPPDLRALCPETPETLVRIIKRMLTRDKAERYRTMRQVAVDLEEIQLEIRRVLEEAKRKQTEEAGRQQKEEASKKQEEEAWRKADEAQRARDEARRKQQAEAEKKQADEAQRKAEAGQKAQEEASRQSPSEAHRLPDDNIPTGIPVSAPNLPAPSLMGPAPRRTLVLVGGGGLVLVSLLAAIGLGAWAVVGNFLSPALSAVTATRTPTAAVIRTLTYRPTSSATPQPPTATETATFVPVTLTPAPTLGVGSTQVYTDSMVGLYVPAGEFLMGSTDADIVQAKKDCSGCNFSEEQPQHTVYLDAFWIDQTEVTNAMYAQCVQTGVCQPPFQTQSGSRPSYYLNVEFAQYPAIYVAWNDALTYCAWAGRRLPTEAEWEKAARGADGRMYPWGNQIPDSILANFNQNMKDTTEVGIYPAGASLCGALDMAGNVWEWVNDTYAADYYQNSPLKNPVGPTSGLYRGLRGGSWLFESWGVRAAFRGGVDPESQMVDGGFRCARSP